MTREELLDAIDAETLARDGRRERDEIRFRCPAHEDEHPSARWNRTKHDGVWRCDACGASGGYRDLAIRLAIDMNEPETRDIVAAYPYADETGALLFEVVRFHPKQFRQRRPDGRGGYIYNLNGTRRVLYRLPEIVAADLSTPIYVTEGEKDVDRLVALGLVATTNSGGAGKWKAEYSETLRRRHVVILPDNDKPGREHAEHVAKSLAGVTASVRIVELPNLPPKGDVSDWLATGGTAEKLSALVSEAAPKTGADSRFDDSADQPSAAWVRIADVNPEPVRWLWPGRIPLGKLSVIEGDPDNGKSTFAFDLAARVSTGRAMPTESTATLPATGAVILSAEDGLADTIRPRLEAAGADLTKIVAFKMESLPDLPADLGIIERAISDVNAALVIFDPLVAFLPAHVNSWRDQDIRQALKPLAALAERTGAAIIVIRHLTKGAGDGKAIHRGGGSIGIAGAARSVLLVAPHPDHPEDRVVARVKNNLAAPVPSLAFQLLPFGSTVKLVWKGEVPHTASELLNQTTGDDRKSAVEEAKEALRVVLAFGSVPAKDVQKELQRAGISRWASEEAKRALRVKVEKDGYQGPWTWSLPKGADAVTPDSLASPPHPTPKKPPFNLKESGPAKEAGPANSAGTSFFGDGWEHGVIE